MLQTPSSDSSVLVQELPIPLTSVRARKLVPPPQDELHWLHSVQVVPMCLQLPGKNITLKTKKRNGVASKNTSTDVVARFRNILACTPYRLRGRGDENI